MSNFALEQEAYLRGGLLSTWIGLLELPRLDRLLFVGSPLSTVCEGCCDVPLASTGLTCLDLLIVG